MTLGTFASPLIRFFRFRFGFYLLTVRLHKAQTPPPPGYTKTATNVSYWQALEGADRVSMGRHVDHLGQLHSGQWVFIDRKIHHTWTKATALLPTPGC